MIIQTKDNFNGIMFIPHPYITQSRPGRRLDESFLATTLSKLDAAFKIAEENNYLPIILNGTGPTSNEHKILSPLFQRLSTKKVIIHAGKSDYKKSKSIGKYLDHNSTTALIATAGIANIISHDKCFNNSLTVKVLGKKVSIVDLQIDEMRPDSSPKKFSKSDEVIMIGSLPITVNTEASMGGASFIKGVSLVVNSSSPENAGVVTESGTDWLFPGTLPRISAKYINQAPAVWVWTPEKLSKIEIEYNEHVFEMSAGDIAKHTANENVKEKSDFVQMLSDKVKSRTDESDNSIVNIFSEVFQDDNTDDNIQNIIDQLYKSVALSS